MKLRIVSEKDNRLLKRKEIIFEVEHEDIKGTPPRLQVKKILASMLNVAPQLVYLQKIQTKTGTMMALGDANTYESIEQAKLIEPKYIFKRNTPSDKPKEEG